MQQQQEESNADAGEFTVTDELYQISEATNDDGTVNVEVFDYEKSADGENVIVHFRTPTGDRRTEMYPWPKADSSEYEFVRLCRQTVGGLNAAEFLRSDGAEVKADPDTWGLCVSKRLRDWFPLKDFLTPPNENIEISMLLLFGISMFVFLFSLITLDVMLISLCGVSIVFFLSAAIYYSDS